MSGNCARQRESGELNKRTQLVPNVVIDLFLRARQYECMSRVGSASTLLQRRMRELRKSWIACLVLALCLVVGLGALLGWLTYRQQRQHLETQFLRRAVQHSRGIHPDKVEGLTGTLNDLESPSYQRLKQHLKQIRLEDEKYRFVYLMRRLDDGTVVILLDSESPDSPDYSPPGDVYDEADIEEQEFFEHGVARVFPPEADRWGTWVSAYAPVLNPETGEVIALFGIDVDAADWQATLYGKLLWPLLIAVVLMAGVAIFCWALRKRGQTHNQFATLMVRNGEMISIAVLGLLLTGFFTWFNANSEKQQRHDSFYRVADRDLARIQQRLEYLRDFVLPSFDRYLSLQTDFDHQFFGEWALALLARPGQHSWGWVSQVPDPELALFEEKHADRFSGIWELDAEGQPQASRTRPVYYPLTAIEPMAEVGEALGYDLGSESRRLAAIEEAIATRLPTASDPIDLAIDLPDREVLMIVHPVFNRSDEDTLLGLIISPRSWPTLMQPGLARYRSHHSFSLLREDAPPHLMFSNCPNKDSSHDHSFIRYVGIFGQVLKLEAHPGPDFYTEQRSDAAPYTLIFGLMMTGATALLLGMPLRQRRLLEALVKERTAELQKSKEEIESLAKYSRTFRWEVDNQGFYTFVSENVSDLIGYRPEELVGKKTFFDLAPEEDWDELKQHAFQLLQAGELDEDYENRLLTKQGQIKWVRTTALPKLDEQGQKTGFYGWDRDITGRKEAEAATLRTERERARLATAIEQSPETIVITDAEGLIEYVNPAFEKSTGYTAIEALGQKPSILKSGEQDSSFYEEMWATIAAGQIWSGRIINRRKDGSLFTEEATISPVRDDKGAVTHYIAIKRDITEELERETMYRQSQKMESIGRLAGGIAHDFNNMLQVILGNTELAMESAKGNELLQQDLNQVISAAKRSMELTRQLLAFSSRQAVKPELINLNKAVPESLAMLKRLLEASIELTWKPTTEAAQIKLDPTQLDQVLVNLCVNARDAIGERGIIKLSTNLTTLSGNELLTGENAAPGDYVVLTVEDDGCGMAPDVLKNIFEPFFTTKQKGRGTGLGLSTVYGILKQNGGYIDVTSSLGYGTTFNLYFPLCEDPVVEVEHDYQIHPVDQDAGILVVDDEADILQIAERTLKKMGYRVWTADLPQHALEILSDPNNDIDLLLTDIVMPEMNGKALAEQARTQQPDLACLFMSGYSEDIITKNGIVSDEVHFLAKPFEAEELAKAVQAALSRK